MFDEMPKQTLSAYNYVIARSNKARWVYKTLSMALNISAMKFSLRRVHTQITKLEMGTYEILFVPLIDSYFKNGTLSYAEGVFDSILDSNPVWSTALLVGCMNEQSSADAELTFEACFRRKKLFLLLLWINKNYNVKKINKRERLIDSVSLFY